MRKPFALRTVLPATFALLVAGSLFAVQACTAGEGTTPTCKSDLDANGNKHLADGCNPFAACAEDPKDPSKCCKDKEGNPFQGQLMKLCLYGYGEQVDLSGSAAAGGGSDGSGGAGGGS